MKLFLNEGDCLAGKEAIRGFLYQGFATILESLTQESWDRIHVEYPSDDDKVDIALEVNGTITKAIQVKSSINLFQKSDVAKWIKELINDIEANKYEVVLIGSFNRNTNDFINSIRKYRSGEKDKKTRDALKDFDVTILDNFDINIKTLPLEEDTLLGIVRDSLHKYLSYKGYMLDFEVLDLLSKYTLSTQMLLGTKESSQSKNDFDSKIFHWVDLTSGGLKSKYDLAKHKLMFYEQEKKILSTSLDCVFIDEYYNFKNYMGVLKKDCIDLINKIDNIRLDPYKKQQSKQPPNDFGIFSSTDFFFTFEETKDSDKDEIINKVKLYFDTDINREFFFVGNLKKEKKLGVFGKYDYKYYGTKTEKEKNELLTDFKYRLLQYEMILMFIEKIKKCCTLPIVIKNVGNVQDENITIKLFIDKSVEIFCGDDYPNDDYTPIYSEIIDEEDNFIENIFNFNSDSIVKSENQKRNFNHFITDQSKSSIDKFYNELDMYIAKPQYEHENYNVIEFEVKGIRPSETIFLNKLVLLHSLNKDLEIKYTIISDKSDGSIEGVLKINYQK